ncbi:MAG: UvrD-helicase domain-containing protein [Woeseia sp.]
MSTDSDLLQADRQARTAALDVTRSFIVQAPAGSGKTELLIQRYLYLLATVAEPEEVVAITFTRKAASEMQLRVVTALRRAEAGDEGEAEHDKRTLAAARTILQLNKKLDWRLLESPRRMRIQTLDAFCASITRLLPVTSGLGGAMTTSANADMMRLYREAAAATLDWLAGDNSRRSAFERVLEHLDFNVGAYVSYLAQMLAKRDQWLQLTGAGGTAEADAVRARLEKTMAAQVAARLKSLRRRMEVLGNHEERRLLRYAGEQLVKGNHESSLLTMLEDEQWPTAEPGNVSIWRTIASQLLVASKDELRKQVDVRSGFPAKDNGEKKAFHSWLAALREVDGLAEQLGAVRSLPDPVYEEEQWQVLLALFDVLPLAVAELQRLFAERGVTDHVEVALAAGTALGSAEDPGDLALLLDYRIRHLLVDEMQDTSTRQYRLIAQITAGWEPQDGRTLFCVGDPMQSIYRFRDAEVGQFLAAREHGIGDLKLEPLLLRQNFRSGEILVNWFNDTFERVFPPSDDVITGAISYAPSVPVPAHAASGAVTIYPLIDAPAQEEATCAARIIESCLAEDAEGDVAVLVRSRTQLPLLLEDLRQRGIAYQAIEIDRLTDLPEIIDLLALTRALCHHGDRIAWLAVLRAPWAGLSWSELQMLVKNDSESTVLEILQDEARVAVLSSNARERVQAMLTILQAFLRPHAVRSLRERVECAWHALGGPAALQTPMQLLNARRFLDVLARLEKGGTVPDIAALESMLDEERVSSAANDATRVQVMTIHKAKGLQFDHVVLPGLGRSTGMGRKDMLAWLAVAADDGGNDIMLSPLAPRAALEKDPLHRFIEQAAKDSEALELDRLLYVACTRAVKSLHLVAGVTTKTNGTELAQPQQQTLLRRLWSVLHERFEAEFAGQGETTAVATADEEPVFASPPGRRFCDPWLAPALPEPPPLKSDAPAPNDREVNYYWVGTAARHAGTIVHRWLQMMAEGRFAIDARPPGIEKTTRRWALSLGVPEHELADVNDRVKRALEAVAGDERGRWLLDGPGHAELRLTAVEQGGVINVVIDRLRIADDVHWLVDYKTSTHEGGDLEGFLQQEVGRYRPQLRRYRDIYRQVTPGAEVRTALYFPLLQRFVEVDADAAL